MKLIFALASLTTSLSGAEAFVPPKAVTVGLMALALPSFTANGSIMTTKTTMSKLGNLSGPTFQQAVMAQATRTLSQPEPDAIIDDEPEAFDESEDRVFNILNLIVSILDLFNIFGEVTLCTDTDGTGTVFETTRTWRAAAFFMSLFNPGGRTGQCGDLCAALCNHQPCIPDFSTIDPDLCSCINDAVSSCGPNTRCDVLSETCVCNDGFDGDPLVGCSAPIAPVCSTPNFEQCNGAGFLGCTRCQAGSSCVFRSREASYCTPMSDGGIELEPDCLQDDFAVCGGAGFTGCQNCKTGSQCVKVTDRRLVCRPMSYESALQPTLRDDEVTMAASYIAGVDPEFDMLVVQLGTNPSKELLAEVRKRMSATYGSIAGRERSIELLDSDASFQQFNTNAANLQTQYCDLVSSPASSVSTEIQDCLCGRTTEDPFVYCLASLEQELLGNLSTGATRKQRDLQKCDVEIGFDNLIPDFAKIARGEDQGPVSASLGVDCQWPLPFFPILSVQIGTSVKIPTGLPSPRTTDELGYRRDQAAAVNFEIEVGLCVTEEKAYEKLFDFLAILGLDLCVFSAKVVVEPFTGMLALEIQVTAGLIGLVVEGTYETMFEDQTRNLLELCPNENSFECSSDSNVDCGHCPGDGRGSLALGGQIFWQTLFTFDVAETAELEACAEYYQGGETCASGIGQVPRECFPGVTDCGQMCEFCCERQNDPTSSFCSCIPNGMQCNDDDRARCASKCCSNSVRTEGDIFLCVDDCLEGGAPCGVTNQPPCTECCVDITQDPRPVNNICPNEVGCLARGVQCPNAFCEACCKPPLFGFATCGKCLPNGVFCNLGDRAECEKLCCSRNVRVDGQDFFCIEDCLPAGTPCEIGPGGSCEDCCVDFTSSPIPITVPECL